MEIDPSNATAWSGIADTYTIMGKYGNASAAAAKATKFANWSGNWLSEGNLLQMQGNYQEAIAKYDIALALNPRNTHALDKKRISLMVLGSDSGTKRQLDQVLEIDPKYKLALVGSCCGPGMRCNGCCT